MIFKVNYYTKVPRISNCSFQRLIANQHFLVSLLVIYLGSQGCLKYITTNIAKASVRSNVYAKYTEKNIDSNFLAKSAK